MIDTVKTKVLIQSAIDNEYIDDIYNNKEFLIDVNLTLLLDKIKYIDNPCSNFVLACCYYEIPSKYNLQKAIYHLCKSTVDPNHDICSCAKYMFYGIRAYLTLQDLGKIMYGYENELSELLIKYDKLEKYTTHLLTKPGGDIYKETKKRFDNNDY